MIGKSDFRYVPDQGYVDVTALAGGDGTALAGDAEAALAGKDSGAPAMGGKRLLHRMADRALDTFEAASELSCGFISAVPGALVNAEAGFASGISNLFRGVDSAARQKIWAGSFILTSLLPGLLVGGPAGGAVSLAGSLLIWTLQGNRNRADISSHIRAEAEIINGSDTRGARTRKSIGNVAKGILTGGARGAGIHFEAGKEKSGAIWKKVRKEGASSIAWKKLARLRPADVKEFLDYCLKVAAGRMMEETLLGIDSIANPPSEGQLQLDLPIPGEQKTALPPQVRRNLESEGIDETEQTDLSKYDLRKSPHRQLSLDLPGLREKKSRGTVIVQIDGLAHEAMLNALEQGYAPNMRELLTSGQYAIHPWLCGIPSITPAVQAALFYGAALPGFTWYDKEKKMIIGNHPKNYDLYDKEASRCGNPGLLEDGQVYLGVLNGGSREAYITGSSTAGKKREKGLQGLWEDVKSQVHLYRKIIQGGAKTRDLLKEYFKGVTGLYRKLKDIDADRTKTDKAVALFGELNKLFLAQMAQKGLLDDIKKGTPVAYINFAAYDEAAHYLGSKSPTSLENLRGIDSLIGEIHRTMCQSKDTDYNLLILSDHGQSPIVKYDRLAGETLRETVLGILDGIHPDSIRQNDRNLQVIDVASTANIYFTGKSDRMQLSEIRDLHPGLAEKLIANPCIGFIAAQEEDQAVIIGRNGKAVLSPDKVTIEGENPFEGYGDPGVIAKQLREYVMMHGTGDLIVFSPLNNGTVIDYSTQLSFNSAHGGLGGSQNEPFIIAGRDSELKPEKLTSARDLYPGLMKMVKR